MTFSLSNQCARHFCQFITSRVPSRQTTLSALFTQAAPSSASSTFHSNSQLQQIRGAQTMPMMQSAQDSTASALNDLFDAEARNMLTPTAIVDQLDRYIVGQPEAKRAVAIALRNRWRRQQLPGQVRDEVIPKNILMIGPTGCGKTEIARRLAKLVNAPFIKVEATKYTELGYVGKDVEDIVKDLVEASVSLVRQRLRERMAAATAEKAEALILEGMVGKHADKSVLDAFRDMYRCGSLDEHTVSLDLPQSDNKKMNFENGIIMLDSFLRSDRAFGGSGKRQENKKQMKVREARAAIEEQESEKVMQSDFVTKEAIRAAEEDGIVFIDEIDKIVDGKSGRMGGSVSSEGVQRDLLPIIEGSVVQTKYGNVTTDHVLFICSGAFHKAKPSDMLAELQGRLPIRVELKGLGANEMYRILTEPDANMIKQQQALLATEGVDLEFTDAALRALSQAAETANRFLDNIGARRLHTVLERILADVSFSAPEKVEEARKSGLERFHYLVDEKKVAEIMEPLLKKQDLSRYVL
ncbi:hypothetical protein CEUSTIGMA_g8799.t1 [Chlamydomonas eustigma]|uniref:AAA+ ATPase domain-containing protein n=1 Tax=Chlamydomonas eustigma TaxID=1157962 RepID=A0A250XE62_9CHLO|nr:hypothetical protein CEUSTIGMA_g8799.t1 [Chlamydomonas eustigma]|eukprot:GAX81368.1 hypothetical protein CEUSTIGMA_g8799.t1 [Chlamydomonas eustigma]